MKTDVKFYCWSIGISEKIQSMLKDYFGQTVVLSSWPENSLPPQDMVAQRAPLIIFVSPDAERAIQKLSPVVAEAYTGIKRVCILPEHYTKDDLELGIGAEATKLLPFDAGKKTVWNLLHEAHQALCAQSDVLYMTKELLLDRELLERKNTLLTFLVMFFSNTTQANSISAVFAQTFEALHQLFPLETMHAATWLNNPKGNTDVKLYINAPRSSVNAQEWEKALLTHVDEVVNTPYHALQYKETLPLGKGMDISPRSIDNFVLRFGNESGVQGILLLASKSHPALGRDQSETLHIALNHLSVLIANHYFFELAKSEAHIDPLTGLYNRRCLASNLHDEISRARRYNTHLSFLMLDVDHFKQVNDNYGHQAGDSILQAIGHIITDTLRSTDSAYRYGGEEFCALMPETPLESAFTVAERLRKKIATHPFMVNGSPVKVTVSIGVAYFNAPGVGSVDTLIDKADSLLYAAKQSGRNCTACENDLLAAGVM